MKLTSVELVPHNVSDAIVLSFRDPRAVNPYNVKAILGLDADEIIPKYYGLSGYNNMFLQRREIVIRLGLNPDFGGETYSELRDAVYKLIASSRSGKLKIKFKDSAEVKAEISGFISKLEAPQFEKTQEIQLTIKCDEPMLKSPTMELVYEPFTFDLSDFLIQDEKSTAPHGFEFGVDVLVDTPYIYITDPTETESSPTWYFWVDPLAAEGFLAGDIIHFSSVHNNKYIYLTRPSVGDIFLADKIGLGSIWPIMFPGNNRFKFSFSENFEFNNIWYYPTYWGV